MTHTDEAVEMVARVICVEDTLGTLLDAVTPTERDHYYRIARAVIAALSALPSADKLDGGVLAEGRKE